MELSLVLETASSFAGPILMGISAVIAMTFLFRREFLGFLTFAGISVMTMLFFSVFTSAFQEKVKWSKEEVDLSPEPTPSSVAPNSPSAIQSAPDIGWIWIALGIIGGLLVIGLLGFLLFAAVRKHQSGALELRQQREAAAADRAKALAIWQRSVNTHQRLRDGAVRIELDWDTVFQYPAILDSTVPSTRDFHRALRAIESVSQEPPSDINLAMDISQLPYPRLVAAAEEAWTAAWSFAKRTGTKLIPREERRKVDQIVKLLRMARDSGGSEHERSIAYDRATKLISELQFVRVPATSLEALGIEARLMIEAGKFTELSSDTIRTPIALNG